MLCLFFAVFNIGSTLLSCLNLFYDNFSQFRLQRYSENETDGSAHSGSAEVVIKLENIFWGNNMGNVFLSFCASPASPSKTWWKMSI